MTEILKPFEKMPQQANSTNTHSKPKCSKERSLTFKEKLLSKVLAIAFDDIHISD